MSAVTQTLARRTLGVGTLVILGIVASSPLTVLVGGIPATFAGTEVVGVPASFVVIMAVLGLLVVGYLSVARYVPHPAPFVAVLARGLGGRAGTAGAVVGFVGYNAIQISLLPFLGAQLSALLGGVWWWWAAGAWIVTGAAGLARMTTNAVLLGALLLVELAVVGLFVAAALTHPAEPPPVSPFSPAALITPGIGGVLALGMAAFVGAECGPVFGEEARSPRTVITATLTVGGVLGVTYAVCAYAVLRGVGFTTLTSGGDPTGAVFGLIGSTYGPGVVPLATMLLITSVLAAMSSFHHVVARNAFGLAREGLLPGVFAQVSTGRTGGTPRAGSLLQSAVAGVVLLTFVGADAEPMAMFTWLSTGGALCVLSLLVTSAIGAYGFYRDGGGGNETVFTRAVAPILGALAGGLVVAFMAFNLRALLGLPPGSQLVWLPLGVLAASAVVGWVWGTILHHRRPEVYQRLGRGAPTPVAVLDQRLAEVEV